MIQCDLVRSEGAPRCAPTCVKTASFVISDIRYSSYIHCFIHILSQYTVYLKDFYTLVGKHYARRQRPEHVNTEKDVTIVSSIKVFFVRDWYLMIPVVLKWNTWAFFQFFFLAVWDFRQQVCSLIKTISVSVLYKPSRVR